MERVLTPSLAASAAAPASDANPLNAPSTTGQAFLLTAPMPAAIAVVRLCGPAVPMFLASHFSRQAVVGGAVHGELRDGGRTLDDPVVALLSAHCADLCVHGGPWVVRSTLDLLGRFGFEVSDRPDQPMPSVFIEAADDLQAEVLAALPLAKTELGVRVLLAQSQAWRSSDEWSIHDRKRVLNDRLVDRLLTPGRVAIAGPANVGKSTLANRLFGRDRAITADLPGTTRDWIGETTNLAGVPVLLIDTPGLRQTTDPIEHAAIEAARPRVAEADVVLLVLDLARPFDSEQQAVLNSYPNALVVLNKTDCPPAWRAEELLGEREVVRVSARSGDSIGSLEEVILRRLGCADRTLERPRCWTARQRAVLEGS